MTNTTNLPHEAATLSAMTGAARLWLGLNAAGHVAQFWAKEPDVSAYPALRIVGYQIKPDTALTAAASSESQPAARDVLRGLICWTEDKDGGLCQCVKTADRITNPEGVFVRLSTLRAALSAPVAPVPTASEGWTENTGQQPAVADNVLIEVEFRNGSKGGQKLNLTADCFRWALAAHDGSYDSDFDIVRWRVRPAAPATSDKAEEL